MNKEWTMLQDDVLLAFLDANANRALERLKTEQLLTVEEAMPLLLKAQFNHIAHLDQSIHSIEARLDTMQTHFDEKFEKIDERFEKIDERFGKIDERFGKIDERFGKIDEKFEKMDEKFERMDEKFERMFHRMNIQIAWMVGTILASSGLVFGLEHLLS